DNGLRVFEIFELEEVPLVHRGATELVWSAGIANHHALVPKGSHLFHEGDEPLARSNLRVRNHPAPAPPLWGQILPQSLDSAKAASEGIIHSVSTHRVEDVESDIRLSFDAHHAGGGLAKHV